ncbi:MAG: galactose-1-phosphate uridylyltransferase [Pseudomonadota bacterium]
MTLPRPPWLQDTPRREHLKPGGRRLWLYGPTGQDDAPVEELPATDPPTPHLRWHPFRRQWVAYAAARQTRTFKPDTAACPLCPAIEGRPPGEIPFARFDVAVFENRFPGLAASADASMIPPDLPIEGAPANGSCEVIVFSADHEGSLAELSQPNREILVAAWTDRYLELYARPEIKAVLPFENRGEEVGVTLSHPHGQIYAFPFIPPVMQEALTAQSEGVTLSAVTEKMGERYTVAANETMHAFVPPFARFPYEVWIAPRRPLPGPWTFSIEEVRDFAALLGEIVAKYDRLFDRIFPYILSLHAAPKGHEEGFHFTAQFYPLLRTADKLKYLAGVEQAAGTFLMDALPEVTAGRLRDVPVSVS